jgi:transcriptional regulator with XRE-family HTH domain
MQRSPLLAQLGAQIRAVRRERGLSQEALADRAGLDRTYVGGIERGERNVSILNLEKISCALNVDIGVFFVAHKGSLYEQQ